MDVFSSQDYAEILKRAVLERKQHVSRTFTFQRLATACKVEKAYLSRVLNGKAHLSQDQLYLACRFLGFSSIEVDYVFLLHAHARSGCAPYKKELAEKIAALRRRASKVERAIPTQVVDSSTVPEQAGYFLDPLAQLVHIFLTVERWSSDLRGLAARLGLSEERLATYLELLQRLRLVELVDGRFRGRESNLHLSSDAPIFKPYLIGQRLAALERLQRAGADEAYSVSATFSATEAERARLRAGFLELLRSTHTAVKSARCEKVFQLNFDLVEWA